MFMPNKILRRFERDRGGNVMMLFAILLAPIILSIGSAIDYGRAQATHTQLQAATDSAVLAAATFSPPHGTPESDNSHMDRRRDIATQMLATNLSNIHHADSYSHVVTVNEDNIEVRATTNVETTFLGLIFDNLQVGASSQAKFGGKGAPLCALALNSQATDTFKVWGTADLIAPKCAVHSNSSSSTGMVSGGSATATAAQFCSSGSHSGGGFTPVPLDDCVQIGDPYEGLFSVASLLTEGINIDGPCDEFTTVRLRSGDYTVDAGGPTSVFRYCGGLLVKAGATLILGPGIYVINDVLEIQSGGRLNAPAGVTVYLGDKWLGGAGRDGELLVQGGGILNLVAPQTGPLAGMAVVQPIVSEYTGGSTAAVTNTIIGGGNIHIVGIFYTPQAKLRITGNGDINANSDYFSMIADFIELEGNGVLRIQASGDNIVAGMPVMESVSMGGDARLTN